MAGKIRPERESSVHISSANDMPRPVSKLRAARVSAPAEEPRDIFRSVVDPRRETPVAEAAPPNGKSKWTVLNYCAADNNLYAYIYDDVASMEQVGSTPAVQLVAQFDHQNNGAYRFRIEKDEAMSLGPSGRIDSPVVESLGKVNMSDPKTLADFIAWGMKKYPSERTMLVIADHGKGWQGLVQDDSHKGWMSVPQLKQALQTAEQETGRKLDVIGFDACLMASVEVASEIKEHAKYMVASQALEGREGWPYHHMLDFASLQEIQQAHLFKSDLEARQAVELVVRSAAANPEVLPTMSAIDLSQMTALEEKLKEVGAQLKAAALPAPALREARAQTQAFGQTFDLGNFLQNLEQLAQSQGKADLVAAVQSCREQLAQTVVAEAHSKEFPNATGLTVELKRSDRDYAPLQFAEAAQWKGFISHFSGR